MQKVSFEWQGQERVEAGVKANFELRGLTKAVNTALHAGAQTMLLRIPRRSGDLAETIHVEEAKYAPGGFGGGGMFDGALVVGDESTDYLPLLLEGTGVHGPLGGRIWASFGNAAPRANFGHKVGEGRGGRPRLNTWYKRGGIAGNATMLQWYENGEPVYRKSVAGQKPQREWLDASRRRVNQVLARKLREIDLTTTRR